MKLFAPLLILLAIQLNYSQSIFISEIHYDNVGTDSDEGFEIAAPSGTNLTGYSVILYSGANGKKYNTINLSSAVFTNQLNGSGFVWFSLPVNGLQNGSPDGLALVNSSNVVLQFLSYEGVFSAVDGAAVGLISTNIGISENAGTPVGTSMQLTDTGWQAGLIATPNGPNNSHTTLSVQKNEIEGFKMYPNPVRNGVFKISSNNWGEKSVEIYSLKGQLIRAKMTANNEVIDVQHLTKGIYVLRVIEGDKIATRKLILN